MNPIGLLMLHYFKLRGVTTCARERRLLDPARRRRGQIIALAAFHLTNDFHRSSGGMSTFNLKLFRTLGECQSEGRPKLLVRDDPDPLEQVSQRDRF